MIFSLTDPLNSEILPSIIPEKVSLLSFFAYFPDQLHSFRAVGSSSSSLHRKIRSSFSLGRTPDHNFTDFLFQFLPDSSYASDLNPDHQKCSKRNQDQTKRRFTVQLFVEDYP